jgi:hypothetical protein
LVELINGTIYRVPLKEEKGTRDHGGKNDGKNRGKSGEENKFC